LGAPRRGGRLDAGAAARSTRFGFGEAHENKARSGETQSKKAPLTRR